MLEDTKAVISSRKSKTDIQHNGHKKKGEGIYKTLHKKFTIEQHAPHKVICMKSGAPEG